MIDVMLERATERVSAIAIDWPGWARAGRRDEDVLDADASYVGRVGMKVPEGTTPRASSGSEPP